MKLERNDSSPLDLAGSHGDILILVMLPRAHRQVESPGKDRAHSAHQPGAPRA